MHGLLVLYTLIGAMYVYVLVYRPSYSYFVTTSTENMPDGRVCTVTKTVEGRRTRTRRVCRNPARQAARAAASKARRDARAARRATAAPIVSTPVAPPPPPPAEAPMMTPETAPPATPAPEVAPAMTPSAAPADGKDTEEFGNNTESAYMAEYPSLF